MTTRGGTPGPDAHSTFRLGIVAAALAALVPLGALYWAGMVSHFVVGFAVVLGFPIYLLYVASVLSVWLGFDKDASDLRPVYRDGDERGGGPGRRAG